MAINREDMIEDLERHIRKSGGELSEWCAGTAKDASAPFFQRHLAAELGDGLAYREAYTSGAADAVIEHLVQRDGLRPDRDAVPERGKIVFVYRSPAITPTQQSTRT
jgi:hypothetical protein